MAVVSHMSASSSSSGGARGPDVMSAVAAVPDAAAAMQEDPEEPVELAPLQRRVCFISAICLSSVTLNLQALAINRRCFLASCFCLARTSFKTFFASARAAFSRATASTCMVGFTCSRRRCPRSLEAAGEPAWLISLGAMDGKVQIAVLDKRLQVRSKRCVANCSPCFPATHATHNQQLTYRVNKCGAQGLAVPPKSTCASHEILGTQNQCAHLHACMRL